MSSPTSMVLQLPRLPVESTEQGEAGTDGCVRRSEPLPLPRGAEVWLAGGGCVRLRAPMILDSPKSASFAAPDSENASPCIEADATR